jgi:hypothetical protein
MKCTVGGGDPNHARRGGARVAGQAATGGCLPDQFELKRDPGFIADKDAPSQSALRVERMRGRRL